MALAGVAVVLLLSGCGGAAPSSPSAVADDGAFPVTITHGQGTVTVPARPQRVVVLGFADAQIATALGAPVVAAARNPSNPDGNWAGVTPPLPPDVTVLDGVTPNLEAIAAAQPDLILMTTAQPTFAASYPQISAIAPTLSHLGRLLEDPGDELVRAIGRATGRTAEADALVARSDATIAAAAARHPELRGRSYAFGQYYGGQTFVVVAPDGPTAEFFGRLGMRVAPGLARLPVQQAGTAVLPPENLAALDSADVAFFGLYAPGDEQRFRSQPLARNLGVLQGDRFRVLTTDEASLLLAPNPATTEAILALVEPTLARLG
ncbi:ABC transporter substrate-binding protein [Pseudonocardia endophytica]|uniref:Iron complex transport system substrate-binding protein n=1 Tax=Pseudonocardia endophytica TaxID=401976 RepID=A0A4R1HIB5_PSEEN|nr:ABC transporter substrate-binding protein [Pseudonocardia endophytica]TCK21538.1 iron complex transport system substrate-binding protein [Pseudonocardia endophytica]